MRIRKLNLRSSFFSLLSYAGYSTSVPDEPVVMGLEDLRDAMLAALGDTGSVRHPLLARQLRFARDAESLWYARSDLMGVLSSLYGELRAREEMNRLSLMFCGVLPPGMTARLPGRPS